MRHHNIKIGSTWVSNTSKGRAKIQNVWVEEVDGEYDGVDIVLFYDEMGIIHTLTAVDFLKIYIPHKEVYEFQYAFMREKSSKWDISDIFLTEEEALSYCLGYSKVHCLEFTKRLRDS